MTTTGNFPGPRIERASHRRGRNIPSRAGAATTPSSDLPSTATRRRSHRLTSPELVCQMAGGFHEASPRGRMRWYRSAAPWRSRSLTTSNASRRLDTQQMQLPEQPTVDDRYPSFDPPRQRRTPWTMVADAECRTIAPALEGGGWTGCASMNVSFTVRSMSSAARHRPPTTTRIVGARSFSRAKLFCRRDANCHGTAGSRTGRT